jgi:hypothetical protein
MKNRILKAFGIAVIIVLILMIASSITKENDNADNPNVGAINQIEDEQVETNIEPDVETVKEINDLMWENLGTNLLECGYDEESGCYMVFLYINAIDDKYQVNSYKIDESLDNLTKCIKETYGVDCAAFLMDSFTVSNIIYSTLNGKEINIVH